jgi:hypothetical protein
MNLFELQERLKDFSQEQLVREMQAPTGTAPQFLVLSELQRRQRMMAEEQAQMQTPQTTVAEDAIAAAGVPQGGLADMARSMAPQTDMDMNTATQPVERMQEGGSVDDRDSGFIRRLLENVRKRARKSRMTDEELAYVLGRPSFNVPEFMSPVAALRDASDLYEEGDYPGAVLNAASAFPAGRIVGPALNVYAEMYNRSDDDDVEGMRGGGVVRMRPGGLARSTGDPELDAALAELERQRLRQAEVLRSLGLQGDEEGLSEVSADVGSYRPSPISAAPMTSSGGLPNIRETQNLLGRIRPSLARQLLDQGAPPSTEDSVDAVRRRLALMDAREDEGPYTEALRSDIERQRRRLTPDDYQSLGETDPLDPRSPSYVTPFDTSEDYDDFDYQRALDEAARMRELNDIPFSSGSLADVAPIDAREDEGQYTEALRSDIERQRRRLTPADYQSRGETDPLDPRSPSYVPPFDTSGAYAGLLGAQSTIESVAGDLGPLQGPMQPVTGEGPYTEALRSDIERQRRGRLTSDDYLSRGETDPLDPRSPSYVPPPVDALPAITPAEMDEIDSMREARRILTSDEAYTLPKPKPKKDTDSGGTGVAAPAVDDAFEQDKWLALAQAGLALMSSQQPTIGGAIGEAGLSGITALRQARTDRDDRIERQQARADRLAAATRKLAPGYEDDAVGDLLTMRQRLFDEATSYFDQELGQIRPGYEERYNDLIKNIDAIDVMVSSATMSRFPGLMEALTEE